MKESVMSILKRQEEERKVEEMLDGGLYDEDGIRKVSVVDDANGE